MTHVGSKYEDPLCKIFKTCLGMIGIRATVDPKPLGDSVEVKAKAA